MQFLRSLTALLAAGFFFTGCATTQSGLSKKDEAILLVDSAASSLNEGDATGALESLNRAVVLDSSNPKVFYLYTLAYHQKKQFILALESAEKAVKLDPKSSQSRNALGKLLLDSGKLNEAEKHLKLAAEDLTNREAYIARTNLGLLYQKRGETEKAEAEFSRAIEEEPYLSCLAAFYRGQIETARGELLKAQADYSKAIHAGCSGFSDAHLNLGKTYIRMKKYDQARAKLLEIGELFPHSSAAETATQLLKEIP